jgi:hypothetical protein
MGSGGRFWPAGRVRERAVDEDDSGCARRPQDVTEPGLEPLLLVAGKTMDALIRNDSEVLADEAARHVRSLLSGPLGQMYPSRPSGARNPRGGYEQTAILSGGSNEP